jgi:hypothetical protein
MDKAIKLAIIVGILLAGFGVFYHYVIYLPGVEQRKDERERAEREEAARRAAQERLEAAMRADQERATAAQRELDRATVYYDCLGRAEKNYLAHWVSECKSQARRSTAQLKNCLENSSLGEKGCRSIHGSPDPSPTCSLSKVVADNAETIYDKAKQQCLVEAKLF